MEQWRGFSSYFDDLHFQLESMERTPTNFVTIKATICMTVTMTMLETVLPHLLDTAVGRNLLKKRLLLPCSLAFEWDERVVRLENSVDFVLPIAQALTSLTDEQPLLVTVKEGLEKEEVRGAERKKQSVEPLPEDFTMEFSRPNTSKKVWKKKRSYYQFQDTALVPIRPTLIPCCINSVPRFQTEEQLAEWVFNAAKFRPLQLNLSCCERSEEVREALLRQFHRWPETKITQAMTRFQTLSQEANQRCMEQVQLYLRELRGKLLGGINSLFWLNVLQPLTHPAPVPRQEAREVLVALLEEIKSIDGVFELLTQKSKRVWAVLTLPLKLEPLFQGVATLALCGQEVSAIEAMDLLVMFAEQYTAIPALKKSKLPVGLSVVASVGALTPLEVTCLGGLPEAFCENLGAPLAMMLHDWAMTVNEVLDVLQKSLTSQWVECELAPFEQELLNSVKDDVQSAFARLSHALAMNQLYAMQKTLIGTFQRTFSLGKVLPLQDRSFFKILQRQQVFCFRESPRKSKNKKQTMRINVGPSQRLISSDCFRLLSLVREVQNDVEVVKPVLGELEVMRLSCSLGMLSSVNQKDFEMEMLEAREFDDDFALFLRREVFASDGKRDIGVKVISLFGKQNEVKHELERRKCWSEEMERNLEKEDQGIYCVARRVEGAVEYSLVLFGWIQDNLFRKSRLRDTATYVLRFLTCLSPDMVCCLSPEDIVQLERLVASMNTNSMDAWKSFSVAFHVERQEEQQDAVTCEKLASVRLPSSSATQSIQLLKGSYPALTVMEPAPATKKTDSTNQRFDNDKDFVTWLVAESKERNLRLDMGLIDAVQLRSELLKATGRWPEKELKAVKDMLHCSLQTSEDQAKDRVQAYIEDCRATLLRNLDNLFDLAVLFKGDKSEPAFVTLNEYVQYVQSNRDIWSRIDAPTRAKVDLPLRLKNQIKTIASSFRDGMASDQDEDVVCKALASFMREFTISSDKKLSNNSDGLFGRAWKKVESIIRGKDGDLLSEKFREFMVEPLSEARAAWFDAVEKVFAVAESVLFTKWNMEIQCSIRQTCEEDEYKLVVEAFVDLLRHWKGQHEGGLATSIRPRARQSMIYCSVRKEYWKPATDQIKVFKLAQSDDEVFNAGQLGTHRLEPGAKVLKAFTIKNHCVVLVTISPQVSFNRRFGRLASLCDFNVNERVIAFVEDGGRVVFYRFNETFSSLEIYKRVELSLRTSLMLPVANVLLVDDYLFAIDMNGSIQSVNLKNQQTSQAIQIMPSGSQIVNSSLFAMADNMVLGFEVTKTTDSANSTQGAELFATASEDFRDIPVHRPGHVIHSQAAQCFDNLLFEVDADMTEIHVFRLAVTVRSDSFRIQHSKDHSVNGKKSDANESDADEADHWLRALYHTFEKFPVRGLIRGVNDTRETLKLHMACRPALISEAMKDNCRCYFQAMMRDLRKLNKPLSGMDFARDLAFVAEWNDSIDEITAQPVRYFLQELVTFVPIQICRAEANSLTVMTNGKATPMDSQSQNLQAVDIARSIRFGLLSPLLESWQGRSVVITSMGKQSTGKSYLLNHLTGSSFAIAGARCTDGAWMSIRVLPKNVLLVVLDFEGLGSFERTEQEDVFLSVLNASISMFTIFRMEMRYDKEVDDLFARFQKGVALIKGDPSLFRGKLYMSVKDVNPNDQKGVLDEFITKFQKMVGVNKGSNFLLDLYSGQLDINCSPPLGTISYYQSLMHAQNFIEESLCSDNTTGFRNGKAFLNCIRLVLAKIAILDWTSLDEGARQFQLSEITSKLPGLLRTGCVIPQEYVSRKDDIAVYLKEEIVLAESGKVIDANLMQMITEYPVLGTKWTALSERIDLDSIPDWEIDLGFDCCSTSEDFTTQVHVAIKQLLRLFCRSNSSIRGGKISREIVADFDAFLAFIVRRRKARISVWVKQMLGGRVPEEWKAIEQQFLGRFQMLLTRCQSKCDDCRLGCMKAASHPGTTPHNCGGSHICGGRCEYCESNENFGKTPSCAKEAGHEGKCECADGDHTCGEDCCMSNSPNCDKRCSLKRGHTDLHKCDVLIHTCGEACSAVNCSGRCVLNVEEPHTAHKCVEVRCMQTCIMDGCNEVCGTLDHFHGQVDVAVVYSVENSDEKGSNTFDAASEAPVVHMCGNGHECQAMCEEDGICRVDVFLRQSSKTFTGARGSFQYTFQEMNGSRKKCTKLLPPGQKMHLGAHTCIHDESGDDESKEDQTIHYCDVRCPCCSYFCKKKYGHFGPHTTSHGNMRNTYFLSDAEEIDIEERKYKAGDLGIAEMCNLYCSKMGREHVHYLDCEQGTKETCVYSGSTSDQRRHCTRKLDPKPDKETDEVLHEQFWDTLGWEDPCTSKMELELFRKCGYKCDAPDHDDKPSYCILPAWHNPATKPTNGFDGFTYVGGHKFECSHVADGGKMHHVFVLDCSGSMSGRPWSDLMAAWREYVYNRIADGATLDLVSVVTFDNYGQIVYEAQNITTMTNANVTYRGGGTNYAAGLRSASEVLSRMNFDVYKPAVVFFSDGHPCDPIQGEQLAAHIRGCYERHGLQAFAVGFGSINLSMLERVAEKLGGVYHHVLTGNELKATFFSISASLSTRAGLALAKPDHERNCVICGQDLASGETVKLDVCSHELHTACLDVLVRNAEQDGEVARCPSCRQELST
ncbi:unnamed protein product [Phytophthora lilii]|uniref:Unnamed protein product n=1 Tax=Phytophthora lilii TaxID=2077276 RepID=A0A9W6TDV3_9STRA|nr:unnamed protein product [Phytophthora lilii]